MQLYTGNQLAATLVGKQRRVYRQGDAVCLETQHLPDSVNQPTFPSTELRPGKRFTSTTELRFENDDVFNERRLESPSAAVDQPRHVCRFGPNRPTRRLPTYQAESCESSVGL